MNKCNIFSIFLLAVVIVGSIYLYPLLPAQIPTHWNIRGTIDQYSPKETAAWMMPGLMFAMIVGFRLLPIFDPNKEKYNLFRKEWHIIQSGLIGFFAFMHAIMMYAALNKQINIMPFMFAGMGSLFILLGNYLSKIRQNYFIGIRTPWTLASEDNWNKTHRYASWTFVFMGLTVLAEALFLWYPAPVIFGSIFLGSFLPVAYSFLLFKKKDHAMKYVYMVIAMFIAITLFIRITSGEDTWICEKGAWIQHGKPSTAKPVTPCN